MVRGFLEELPILILIQSLIKDCIEVFDSTPPMKTFDPVP